MKDKEAENTQSEQQKKKTILKEENSLRNLWDNFKYTSICIMRVPKEERNQGTENQF